MSKNKKEYKDKQFRIVKVFGLYQPQRKGLLFWTPCFDDGKINNFQTIDEARNYILKYKQLTTFEVVEYL